MHVLDPSLEEEMAQNGKLTIVQNIHREICSLQLLGQDSIAAEKILLCSSIASSKIAEITAMLKEALALAEENLKAL
jgi:exosome complex component RRP45